METALLISLKGAYICPHKFCPPIPANTVEEEVAHRVVGNDRGMYMAGFAGDDAPRTEVFTTDARVTPKGASHCEPGNTRAIKHILVSLRLSSHTTHNRHKHNKAQPHHITCKSFSQWGRQLYDSFSTFGEIKVVRIDKLTALS